MALRALARVSLGAIGRNAGRLAATICSFTPSTAKRRTPSGSGLESGPLVGFGRRLSPIALASSVAASIVVPSASCAIIAPPSREPSVIGAQ